MAIKYQPISIKRIYLDNDNPRHDPIANELEIIGHLLGKEQVGNLAKDIAALGTSPLERFAVIAHPSVKNSFIVLEGNRRLCALKLLHDPDKAPTEPQRKIFRDLSKSMQAIPASIDAVIFPDRDQARPWLQRRHEGAMNGIGTRSWDPDQQARFNMAGGKPTNPNVQASLLLQYALSSGLITKAERGKISITTLTRFLSNPVFRSVMGLAAGSKLTINVPEGEFKRVAIRFLKDALKGNSGSVNSRTSAVEREAYAHKLQKNNVAPATRIPTPVELDPAKGQVKGGAGTGKPTNKVRHSQNPDKRPTVIPSDFVFPIKNRILKRIYDELRSIDSEEYSFAAAYLVRAMVEQTAKVFCKDNNVSYNPGAKVHVLIELIVKKLVSEGVDDKKLKTLRVMASDKDDRVSPETLGAWVHGGAIPTRSELNRRWDTIQDSLGMLLPRLK